MAVTLTSVQAELRAAASAEAKAATARFVPTSQAVQRTRIGAMAERLTRSRRLWERRLAIVLLWHFARAPRERASIRRILVPLRAEKEPYIRKALTWIDKDLSK
jgi:hypothetical protein